MLRAQPLVYINCIVPLRASRKYKGDVCNPALQKNNLLKTYSMVFFTSGRLYCFTEPLQSVSKIRHVSPLIPQFYDVTWLIFETLCKASFYNPTKKSKMFGKINSHCKSYPKTNKIF